MGVWGRNGGEGSREFAFRRVGIRGQVLRWVGERGAEETWETLLRTGWVLLLCGGWIGILVHVTGWSHTPENPRRGGG